VQEHSLVDVADVEDGADFLTAQPLYVAQGYDFLLLEWEFIDGGQAG
jgi:hypothetical protein